MKDGFVHFNYHGWHEELVTARVTPSDVAWASELLGSLSDPQWTDAFRAGGYERAVANRFIRRIRQKIEEGHRLGETHASQGAAMFPVPRLPERQRQ